MVMGNARGEKDGEGTSGSKSHEEGFLGSSLQDWVLSQHMSHSPNHSASGTFQPHLLLHSNHNAVAPMLGFNQNPMRNDIRVEPRQGLFRVRLSWTRGGSQVAVTGSWDNWATREWLLPSRENGFHVIKMLPPGEYCYLFIVDGYLRYAPDSPLIFDSSGSACNVLDLQGCDSELPEHLSEFETPQSPPSSYTNELLNEDDFSKLPPETPPQLQTSLNELLSSFDGHRDPLPQPQHLNHLYIQTHVEGRFTALGSTRRFRQKYVPMVLYKPLR